MVKTAFLFITRPGMEHRQIADNAGAFEMFPAVLLTFKTLIFTARFLAHMLPTISALIGHSLSRPFPDPVATLCGAMSLGPMFEADRGIFSAVGRGNDACTAFYTAGVTTAIIAVAQGEFPAVSHTRGKLTALICMDIA